MTTLPEEAVKAAQNAFNEFGYTAANEKALRAALTAALPFLSVQGAVKKLEWELVSGDHYAEGSGTHYNIYEARPDFWNCVTVKPVNVRLATNVSLEAAKAAAQADYEARILSALEPSALDMGNPITLTYTNYRGETSERAITPIRPWFGSTEWHPEPQWLLRAYDHDKGAERDFALKDFGRQQPSAARSLALEEAARVCDAKIVSMQAHYDQTDNPFIRSNLAGDIALISHLASAIRALSSPDHSDAGKVERDGWLPIESAPKDETLFLAYCPADEDFPDGRMMIWKGSIFAFQKNPTPNHLQFPATHWRTLPSAPSQEVAGS